MNATANTVSNTPVITIQEPGAKATNAQLRVIGHAVKENQLVDAEKNFALLSPRRKISHCRRRCGIHCVLLFLEHIGDPL